MADLFTQGVDAKMPSPALQGQYIPNMDGAQRMQLRGYRVPWGGATLLNRATIAANAVRGSVDGETQGIAQDLSSIISPLSSYMKAIAEIPSIAQGVPGAPGPAGAVFHLGGGGFGFTPVPGANGADGVDGKDGTSIVWQGSLTEHPSNPQEGWAYYSSTDRKSYIYHDGAWYQMTVDGVDGVNGVDGADGVAGTNGVSIVWKGTYASHPLNPQNGWSYYNSTDKRSYVYQDNTWYQMTVDGVNGTNGAAGVDGTDGRSITWRGTYASHPANPEDGWAYYNSTDKKSYVRQSGQWYQMTVDGINGINGTDGVNGADGTSIVWKNASSSHLSNPQNGWAYYNTTDKKSYVYQSGTWYQMTVDGVNGINGANGVNGADGVSIVWKNASASHLSNPQNGWAYYNTTDKKSYVYQSGTWYQMTVDGIDGADGADGVDGKDGTSIDWRNEAASHPSNPQDGWAYYNTTDKKSYVYHDGAWYQMTVDGINGTNGLIGAGMEVTYHDNPVSSPPSQPTGNGTTDGWHRNLTSATVWMSTRIARQDTAVDLATNLAGHWKLDENAADTSVVDSSGNGRTGTATANTNTFAVTGKLRGAFQFVSTNQKDIAIAHHASLGMTSGGCVAFWLKQTVRGDCHLLGKGFGWSVFVHPTTHGIGSYVSAGSTPRYSYSNPIPLNTWVHVICFFSASSRRIYINGVDATLTEAVRVNPLSVSDVMSIGNWRVNPPYDYCNAVLDDVRVYNRLLTDAEALALYNGGHGTEEGAWGLPVRVQAQDGISITWKGESATPPANPEVNWVYRDTDNGRIYIWDGDDWDLMTLDGDDGVDGAAGTNGLSVFITYHDNPAGSPPSAPTGDGTTNGWHTLATPDAMWISQKVASSASAGTWGSPIRIKGQDGLSVTWKGELASPPANPQVNWVYKDTDNGVIYIWDGNDWDVMTQDGDDGPAGTTGPEGRSILITYHDNPASSPPGLPTGDGVSDGWHVVPTGDSVWISQRIASPGVPSSVGTGLRGHWRLNDNAADTVVVDASGNSRAGTATHNTSTLSAPAKINSGFKFDKTVGNYITVPVNADWALASGGTLCFWLKYGGVNTAVNGARPRVLHTSSWSIYLSGTNTLRFRSGSEDTICTLPVNEWVHVAIQVQATGHKIYLNGVDATDIGGITTMPASATPLLWIGAYSSTQGLLNDYLDDVRVYNRVLSEEEINGLYNEGEGTEDGAWGIPLRIKGQDGVTITWKGESANPPANPQVNWVYRDTDNGRIYIWDGDDWDLMVLDGDDGVNGTNGTNGLSVFITYHDNPVSSPPSTPTGDGTSGGWHTLATSAAVWISQKVAASASSGTWGTPIRIKGQDGLAIVWKGESAAPPSNPQVNWVYRDIDNGYIYIWDGDDWDLMTLDGDDGVDGTDGHGVYIVYHNNSPSTPPATPVGDGTTGGWYTTPSVSSVWISQKVAADASSGTWGVPIRIKGQDGLSITWKGESTTPPSNPQVNWVYKDTDNGYIYIWTGSAWELMVQDGDDGVNGTPGSNGLSVFITYHANAATSPPSTPTGDGTTGGWHTTPTSADVWISQKVAATASSGTWGTPIRIKGTDGLSVVWKGESAAPPANPQLNWAYRDTDNGYIYIYNGTAWELMVHDGSDGTDGANGANGLSVFITYHDNAASSPPSTPTGDGTTGGWHTNTTTAVVWMSQKIAASASSGTWGTPIRIKGTDGVNGVDGTDAFEDVEIPMPYDGWEMAFTDNYPSAGYVSWTSFKVKYLGNSYTIAAGNSNRAFLYWNSASPTSLIATNTKTESIGYGKWIVCNNQSGTAYPSSFTKILGAGHIKANTIEADHIVTNAITADKVNANAITAAKINNAAVETAKINNSATKILSTSYNAGALGPLTTSEANYAQISAHPSIGNQVKLTASFIVVNSSGSVAVKPSFALYYNGVAVATTVTRLMGAGEYQTEHLVAYVSSTSGNKAVHLTGMRSAGQSAYTYLYNVYLEAVEDKGK